MRSRCFASNRPRKSSAHWRHGALVVAATQDWPDAQIPWADVKNRPTLRLVAQAIDLALAAQDQERARAWMRWMVDRDPEDAHGWRSVIESLRRPDESQP